MKLSTLLAAYEECQTGKLWHERLRDRGIFGIASDKDVDAIKWQRYDRILRLVRRGIVRRVKRIEGVKP